MPHATAPLSLMLYAGDNLKLLLFLLLGIALTACDSSNELDARSIYWKNELEHKIPIGTPKDIALKHLQDLDSNATENLISGNINSSLQTVTANNPPCKNWVITGTTVIKNGAVTKHSIAAVGRCL